MEVKITKRFVKKLVILTIKSKGVFCDVKFFGE